MNGQVDGIGGVWLRGGMAMIIKKGSPSHELPADDVLKGCERGERGW